MNISIKKEVIILTLSILITTVSYGQRSEGGERPDGPPSFDKILEELDTDEDDKISLKEAKGPLKKDFSKIDSDEDGFITKEELKSAPKPERRERN